MTNVDIRWQQRYNQFAKAFALLQQAMAIENLNVIERAGLIKYFEMTFELAWKLLKEFEESEGFVVKSPREAIKYAFKANYLKEGHAWIEALEDRNLTTHTYNEETALLVIDKIRKVYYPLLQELQQDFSKR